MILPAFRDKRPELELKQPVGAAQRGILSPGALAFVAELAHRFTPELLSLLDERQRRQTRFDAGELPGFLPETQSVRESAFRVADIPAEVADRRTEITGPVSRKMVINALNAGARVYMADFEDSTAPSWHNVVDGQVNLYDAVRRQIDFTTADGKAYKLAEDPAVLMVRPRGLHLPEAQVCLGGKAIPGCLLDFGLYLYHNHQALAARGSRPYFYLPKLEHYTEARWWNRVINFAEERLGLSQGTVRVTVLIETLPAVFQMDEILFELRQRILGLNCGRWDYIFSYIKTFREDASRLLPDREQVGMTSPFLAAYSKLLIATCHRRGAFAMGGMAAQIPLKNDPEGNARALARVQADKAREAGNGHDGTWVAHPALVGLAKAEFDAVLKGPNQIDKQVNASDIGAEDLLAPAEGQITEQGVRGNLRVALAYLAAWLGGNGCVPIAGLMEDAATAEIARAQLWHWRRHKARTEDGQCIDGPWLKQLLAEEAGSAQAGEQSAEIQQAVTLLQQLLMDDSLGDFLTLPAYQILSQSNHS